MELGETSEEAVIRELKEETGIGVIPREVLMVDTTIGGFYGDVVVIAYEITLESSEFTPGDDALEVKYFNYDELPRLTFQSHRVIIDHAFEGLESRSDK